MSLKPTLLVVALATAALASVGCEQRSANSGAPNAKQSSSDASAASSQMAANSKGEPSSGTEQSAGQMATNPGAAQAPGQMAANPGEPMQKAVAPDDAAITAKVKAALLAEPGLKSAQINVDTQDATVTLTGDVTSDMLRDRAKQVAMATDGVKNVVDNLNVRRS